MALTKTLNFDESTLNILRKLDWSADGLQARITAKLDRSAYEQVNKALVTMGGKWTRGVKAHVFKTDPRAQVDGLLDAGKLIVEKDGFFETPPHVVEWMLQRAKINKPGLSILEPSAGMGAIIRPIWKRMLIDKTLPLCAWTLVEKNADRVIALTKEFNHFMFEINKCDFTDYRLPRNTDPTLMFDRILMNPPFENAQDIDHVKHAYRMLAPGGIQVAIMSEGTFSRADKKASSFRRWLALETDSHNQQLPPMSFKTSGTGVNTRIVTIRKPEASNG